MEDQCTLLLTGAGGFVGRHVRDLAESVGLKVIATDRRGVAGARLDLLDRAGVASCVEDASPDLVVNMAGAASVAASWERGGDALDVNATGVTNLLEAVGDICPAAHILCVSSAQVYGEPAAGQLPFREDQPLSPVTPYGESKAAMEATCERLAAERGMRIAVVRAFNLIGPGQAGGFSVSGFAREFAEAELSGADLIELAVGNPDAARDFTDVRDAARAFVGISRAELAGTYNLCSGRALKLSALIAEMAAATRLPVSIRQDPALQRPADPSSTFGDPTRLQAAIGWSPEIQPSRTVADLLDWWRRQLAPA